MADTTPNIGDLLNFFGGANPVAGIGKTIEQFRTGVGNFLKAVETFNTTMDAMQGVAHRVQGLIDDVEAPLRAAMPQVTSVVNSAQQLIDHISDPIKAIVPQIESAVSNAAGMVEAVSEPMKAIIPQITGAVSTAQHLVDQISDPIQRVAPGAGPVGRHAWVAVAHRHARAIG